MIQRPEWVLCIVLDEVHRLPDLCCGEQWLILRKVDRINSNTCASLIYVSHYPDELRGA
jgi:hypothetical protein